MPAFTRDTPCSGGKETHRACSPMHEKPAASSSPDPAHSNGTGAASSDGSLGRNSQVHDAIFLELSPSGAASLSQTRPSNPTEYDKYDTREPLKSKSTSADSLYPFQKMDYYADRILARMGDVAKEMGELEAYINSQKAKDRPLHLWQKYEGYSNLKKAICALITTVADMQPVHLPEDQARIYRCRAREYSTVISKIAIFILGHMNTKCDTCIDEIEASVPDAETQQEANSRVTAQIAKVLKYCSLATSRTWEAFDRLEASCMSETIDRTSTAMALESLHQELALHPSRQFTVTRTGAILTYKHGIPILALFLVYLFALFQQNQSATALAKRHPPSAICAQTLELVEHTRTVANLTGEMYNFQLAELTNRYQALEMAAESCRLRIDNLVDALGAPDEQGTYRSPGRGGVQPKSPADVMQRLANMEAGVERQIQRLQREMEQMRRNVNRMDIRLTKRVDGVNR